jgi:uncharacterized iron-regulated protein
MRPLRILCLTVLLTFILAGCATTPSRYDWEQHLRGDNIVMLGEVHDNPEHHRLRAGVLRRAVEAGWRPALAMEQFDRERQPDIERARRERPHDARHVIHLAGLAIDQSRNTWPWEHYQPFIELALEYDLPLIAANLSRADIGKIMKDGYAAVFDAPALESLGLARPPPADLQATQERAIARGHCNALPPAMIPAMTRGQLARDAVMAATVSRHAERGVVRLAGNSHVNRIIGAPRWLGPELLARTVVIGYFEDQATTVTSGPKPFDTVVLTIAATRSDPCADLLLRFKKAG